MADILRLSFREDDVGRTIDELRAELAKLRKPVSLGGRAAHFLAGGEQRIFQLESLVTHMECNELTVFARPGEAETNYSKRIREELAADDISQFERETQEPPSDLQSALQQRSKALEQMDRALDAIEKARTAESEALAVILQHAPGKQTQEFCHLGHSAAALMARLGDLGFARDVRWDKSAPSPRLATLAECHEIIRTQTKEVA